MRGEQWFVGDALDDARFTRRNLADIGRNDRILAVRDRREPHRDIEFLERDMPVRLSERRFRFEKFRVDQALDDNFRLSWNEKVDRACTHDVDRRTGETSGNGDFVHVDRQFLWSDERNIRRAPEHYGARHWLAALLVLEVMLVT